MIDGIVLAGGYSSRAKTNKMVLQYKDKPLILNTIEMLHKFCSRVIVVTGHYHSEMLSLLKNIDYVEIKYNQDYENGMFSSIKKGVEEVGNDFLIIPGDYPNIAFETYEKIINANSNIIVPSYNHRLGHPIFFASKYKEKILNTELNNLKEFRNSYEYKIVEVNDPGILQDIDSIDDYKNLLREE